MRKNRVIFWMMVVSIVARAEQPLVMEKTKFIGHRGAAFHAPENTLAAVRAGLERGADMIEIDVHASADGRIMVIHDHNTKRTTGKSYQVAKTSSDTLRQLDAGSWKGQAFAGEKIPFLEDVLALMPEDKTLLVEIKSSPRTVQHVEEVLAFAEYQCAVNIISFDIEVLLKAQQLMPEIPLFYVFAPATPWGMKRRTKRAAKEGFAGIDVLHTWLNPKRLAYAKNLGLQVFCWTVNAPERMATLEDMGVDGVATDVVGRRTR